jgi:hypothetical protein
MCVVCLLMSKSGPSVLAGVLRAVSCVALSASIVAACGVVPTQQGDEAQAAAAARLSGPEARAVNALPHQGDLASQVRAGGWAEQTLPGKKLTVYQAVQFEGRNCLQATAQSSASLLRRKLVVEPGELGQLKFSWRVPALIEAADLTRREGEDSPVRVVLAFDGDHGELDLRTRAMFDLGEVITGERPPYATLMYVWENQQAPESLILNPRSDRIRKIVVESGAANLGRWLSYERDVVADYQRAFGRAPGRLIGIAVMTDSDNTDSDTEALYGELSLLSRRGKPL